VEEMEAKVAPSCSEEVVQLAASSLCGRNKIVEKYII